MTVGLLLAASLMLVGALAALRQKRALRALADEPFVADADRRYRHGQAVRRILTSGLLVAIGVLIAVYYLSGMDARMDAIPDRSRDANSDPPSDSDKEFARRVGFYWIGVLGLVFVAVCLAVRDFWATRKYWMVRYRELKADHDTKLQRDLAVYRQQKLNARAPGLKPPPDDAAANPPA